MPEYMGSDNKLYSRAREPDYDAEMTLPAGKTCGDCVHCARCCAMFGHTPTDTKCDFWPSRYRERRPAEIEGTAK